MAGASCLLPHPLAAPKRPILKVKFNSVRVKFHKQPLADVKRNDVLTRFAKFTV